jgi:hypothetical protein
LCSSFFSLGRRVWASDTRSKPNEIHRAQSADDNKVGGRTDGTSRDGNLVGRRTVETFADGDLVGGRIADTFGDGDLVGGHTCALFK